MPQSGVFQEDVAARLKAIGSTQLHSPFHDARTPTDARPARFLRLSEVRSRVGYSRASIYRLVNAGEFPRPYSLGARAVAWLETSVDDWIAARVAAGQTQAGNGPASAGQVMR